MDEATRKRFRELLLKDLQSDFRHWYLITVAGTVDGKRDQMGGVFVRAHGPTDAWSLMHRLGLYPDGGEDTMTHGPIGLEEARTIPENMRWRFLTKEELHSIGK